MVQRLDEYFACWPTGWLDRANGSREWAMEGLKWTDDGATLAEAGKQASRQAMDYARTRREISNVTDDGWALTGSRQTDNIQFI